MRGTSALAAHWAFIAHTELMTEWDTPKGWIVALPHGQPDSVALGRVVDADGGQDEAENSYYEAVADPDFVRLETQRTKSGSATAS